MRRGKSTLRGLESSAVAVWWLTSCKGSVPSGTVINPLQLGRRSPARTRGWHQDDTIAPSIKAWLSSCAHSCEGRMRGGTSCTLSIPANSA